MLDREALNRLFRYGCSLTHDEQSAYDLLQDGLEASLRKAPRAQEGILAREEAPRGDSCCSYLIHH